jgi:uncharacterized protein (DUF486 family)
LGLQEQEFCWNFHQPLLVYWFFGYQAGPDPPVATTQAQDAPETHFIPAAAMNRYTLTIALLAASNVFMTFAWYGHLKNMAHKPWIIAALISWGIALLEYMLQVPANRIGHNVMSVGQLKILQEVITLSIFVPFSVLYLKERLTLDYLWAGLCLLGAVFFLFRSKIMGA